MCLAQGPQRNDTSEARTRGLRSRVKHSTTEPLRSHYTLCEYTGKSIGTNSASEHSGEESDGYTSEEDAYQPLSVGART